MTYYIILDYKCYVRCWKNGKGLIRYRRVIGSRQYYITIIRPRPVLHCDYKINGLYYNQLPLTGTLAPYLSEDALTYRPEILPRHSSVPFVLCTIRPQIKFSRVDDHPPCPRLLHYYIHACPQAVKHTPDITQSRSGWPSDAWSGASD